MSRAHDTKELAPSLGPLDHTTCAKCGQVRGDHHPKCPNRGYGRFFNAEPMPDEIRCNYRSSKTHYAGGVHPIPENFRRCHSRKSMFDDEYCRNHRSATEAAKNRKKKFDAKTVKAVLRLMDQLEPEDNKWEVLKDRLQRALAK